MNLLDIAINERRARLLSILNELKNEEKSVSHKRRMAKLSGNNNEEAFQDGLCSGLRIAITKLEKYIQVYNE